MRKRWLIIFPVNSNPQKLIAAWQPEIHKLEFNSANPHFKLQGIEYKYDRLVKGQILSLLKPAGDLPWTWEGAGFSPWVSSVCRSELAQMKGNLWDFSLSIWAQNYSDSQTLPNFPSPAVLSDLYSWFWLRRHPGGEAGFSALLHSPLHCLTN